MSLLQPLTLKLEKHPLTASSIGGIEMAICTLEQETSSQIHRGIRWPHQKSFPAVVIRMRIRSLVNNQ